MKGKKLSDWDKGWMQGFAAACSITLQNHHCETIVEDTFKCNFMSVAKMNRVGVDAMDIEVLKPIVKELNRKRKLTQ